MMAGNRKGFADELEPACESRAHEAENLVRPRKELCRPDAVMFGGIGPIGPIRWIGHGGRRTHQAHCHPNDAAVLP
jgi:hypothetical protein